MIGHQLGAVCQYGSFTTINSNCDSGEQVFGWSLGFLPYESRSMDLLVASSTPWSYLADPGHYRCFRKKRALMKMFLVDLVGKLEATIGRYWAVLPSKYWWSSMLAQGRRHWSQREMIISNDHMSPTKRPRKRDWPFTPDPIEEDRALLAIIERLCCKEHIECILKCFKSLYLQPKDPKLVETIHFCFVMLKLSAPENTGRCCSLSASMNQSQHVLGIIDSIYHDNPVPTTINHHYSSLINTNNH